MAFSREVKEETGCEIKNIKKIGITKEYRTQDNFVQISHVYVAEVKKDFKGLNLTSKEIEEGTKVIWVLKEEGLNLISSCFNEIKPSKYENLYHTRFIVLRDKAILEYYLKNQEKDDNKWNKLYENYINNEYKGWDYYFKEKIKLKKKFINFIKKYSITNKPVLECGCGTGKTSVYLASIGLKAYAMDLEDAMVKQTRLLSEKVVPNNVVKTFKGNILKIPFKDKYFSVTHSSGVLEHYEDEKIVKFINEQIRVSDYCIFSVPSKYFDKKMLGNERFLTRRNWRKIIKKSNAKIVRESGYHYKNFKRRVLDIIKKPSKLFKPIALYTFVLKEKEKK